MQITIYDINENVHIMAFPHCDVHDIEGLLWAHVALVSLCVILIVASFNSQFKDAAPYGRHAAEEKAKAWGFPVKQRVAHIVSCPPLFL